MPSESHFEPCSQRYGLFLVCGCRHLELLGAFWGRFPGHIMELEGRKEHIDMGKSSRTCSVPTVSLRLAVLNVFQGFFGPKMAVFGPKLQFLKLRSATCESRSRPPPLSFLLKLCVIVLHTHRYHPPNFHPNLKHHDGVLIFPHFARAAACCLLAAKPGRSTLDTTKGYKTKTDSTSSVTIPYRTVLYCPAPLRNDSAHAEIPERRIGRYFLGVRSSASPDIHLNLL